jgi:hypothetical protein
METHPVVLELFDLYSVQALALAFLEVKYGGKPPLNVAQFLRRLLQLEKLAEDSGRSFVVEPMTREELIILQAILEHPIQEAKPDNEEPRVTANINRILASRNKTLAFINPILNNEVGLKPWPFPQKVGSA